MRRPPDKEGNSAMTERDVVSSNATLNAFLGGSRQKSWMIAGGAPVRPTPRRPSITKPSDQSNANNPQRTSTTTLLSPVTSNESSSPGLAQNCVPLQNTHTASFPGTHGSSRVNATIATSQALQEACITPSNSDIAQPRVLPDAARGEPDEPCTVTISARPPLSEETSQLQTSADITSTGNPSRDSLPKSSSDPNISSRAPSVTKRNSEILPAVQAQVDQTMLSHAQRPQGRPSFRPTMPSLKPRAEMVKKYIERYGGMASLNSALEKPRFSLMETACKSDDAHYVATHQLFCVWDTSRKDITGITELPDSVTLTHAFRILGQLIRDNEGMAPNHLRWFANFPSPFTDLMKNSEPYRRIVQEVGTFLSKLVSNWSELTRICASRGHPPLVDELINELGLLSPTLQNIVFTATRRNLNIVDDGYGNEMEKVFEQDRIGHRELAARYNTSRPPSEKEIRERTKTIIQKYMMISLKARQKMMTNIAPQPSTAAPATPSSIGQTSRIPNGPYPHLMGSSFNSNQNTPQQNHVQNRQTGQTLSQIRTSFTRSSSPLMMASATGSHQSITPRTGVDTPGAIPIQALSMGSPVQQGFQYSSPILRGNGSQFPPSVLQSNGSQSPIIAQNQGLPQGQYNFDPRFDMRQQQHYPQPYMQQANVPAQYGPNNPQQMSSQQFQQIQMHQQHLQHQQQQQHWLQHQMSQQQQAQHQPLAPQRQAHPRRDNHPINGQQQQQPVLSRNASRNSTRNNSVSGERVSPLMSGSIYMRNNPQGNQGPPYPRPMSIEEQECIQYSNMPDPMKRSFIPPLGFIHPQGIPDPDMKALHQANLRSPRLVTIATPNLGCDGVSRRFYQFVKDFPMAPTKIPFESSLNRLEFQISADALTRISSDKLVAKECLMVREVKSQSLQFRLRCVSAVADANEIPISRWVVSDTVWPEMIFVDINSHELEARRKWHHGRDLPIDITPYVNSGTNEITISMPKLPTTTKEREYFLAVEEIEILQHNEIMDKCKEQSIPAATVVEEIKKKLAGPTEDDDELSIVVTDLSIGLTDPFTSRIFEIPVRGKNCLHRECFDLATFLSTRPSKPKRPDQPCMVDVWKCPLCSEDARPYSLRYDEFLASVRDKLQEQDKLDVKTILVAANGTWRPKVESQPSHKRKSTTDDDDDDSIDEERPRKKSTNDVRHTVIEIIELDDD
ncbi:uncharacterized protein EAF02_005409 [Botrytis sinoallii]|uniref:uncharacterized protein n=1 Tax=Botrytis sinoallii TaxID=1463999 RepID=UPI0018FF1693|nr:uncharacterized protein EAF02_005409 [Botrytis sinoallii]KAF7883489.1 hypothetical protein EAF02_005409 [Botrytis sinoallii]